MKGVGRKNESQEGISHYLMIKHLKWLMLVFTTFGLSY